ncbi:hypothetical protein ABU162_30025 [Paenibacillus thiaminolyticus]|uniref:hypothetical protein n=1 Tax=Paenibacillus thiaminolyticus TaxID=49283 RepID=UPI0035A71F49
MIEANQGPYRFISKSERITEEPLLRLTYYFTGSDMMARYLILGNMTADHFSRSDMMTRYLVLGDMAADYFTSSDMMTRYLTLADMTAG